MKKIVIQKKNKSFNKIINVDSDKSDDYYDDDHDDNDGNDDAWRCQR